MDLPEGPPGMNWVFTDSHCQCVGETERGCRHNFCHGTYLVVGNDSPRVPVLGEPENR
jgi:hypothetical protein